MKKFTVVCGEFDTEAEAKVLSDILGNMGIKAVVTEKGGDSSNLTDALLLIAEELQKSNAMQAQMTERVIGSSKPQSERKPLDISKLQTEDEPEPEHKLYNPEKAEELMSKPLSSYAKQPLGEVLKAYRLGKKLSQKELAMKSGLTAATIYHYETGRAITKQNMLKLLGPLEIPIDVIQPYLNDFKGDVYHA